MNRNEELRKRAVELLSTYKIDSSKWGNDVKRLVEELSIYHIELEHQNDALTQAQENLEKLNKEYYDLFDNAPVSHVLLNHDHTIYNANNTFCRIFSVSKEEVIGSPFENFVSPLFQDTFYHFFRLLQKNKMLAQIDLRMKSKQRGDIFVKIDASEQDTNHKFRLAISDISLQKKLENKLRSESEKAIKIGEMFRRLVENSSDIFFYQDIHSRRFEYINDRVIDILGYTPDEVMRMGKKEQAAIILPQYRDNYYSVVNNILEAEARGKRSFIQEYQILTKNNQIKWIKGTYTLARDLENNPYQLIGCLQEISHIKLNEQLLISEKDSAQESNKNKSSFLANMSHEIRNPLNAIIGFSNLLKENLSGDENQEDRQYLDIIEKNGKRLTDIINDIIFISKLESGTMRLIVSEFDINSVVSDCYLSFKKEAEDKGLQLIVKKSDTPILINSDKEKITSAIYNLVNNSLKYTEHGSVTFGAEKRENEVYFFVKDTGIGIPDDKKASIFNRFNQITQTSPSEGVGLGLSIFKGIVNLIGGKMGFDSEVGKGSMFFFTIPLPS